MSSRTGVTLTWRLLVAWWLLIIYGSFIPFRLYPEGAWSRLLTMPLAPYQEGVKNFSIPDVVSNVLLFVPFGFLVAAWRRQSGAPWPRACTSATLAAVAGALGIEIGQLFLAARVSSLIDVEANALGAAAGAAAAWLSLGRFQRSVQGVARRLRDEPPVLGAALLVLFLAAQSFYPFALTLDVGTLWDSVKHGRWVPWRGPGSVSVDGVVRHALPQAVLAVLIAAVARRRASATSAALVATTTAMTLAVALELGKVFFAGRYPNATNAVVGSLGAALGVVAAPFCARLGTGAAVAGALGWLVYTALWPFHVVPLDAALARVAAVEWLPLTNYIGADPESALFDLWTKLVPAGLLGFALAVRGVRPWQAVLATMTLGAVLESLQLFLPPRVPASTDVVLFGFGAWLGAWLFHRWRGPSATSRDGGAGVTRAPGAPRCADIRHTPRGERDPSSPGPGAASRG